MKKRVETRITTISSVITAICTVFTAFTVFFSFFPALNPLNDNLLQKAEAGHVKSQVLLANHYFEINDYEQSIYWYKIISSRECKYQDMALNNLGYIYAEGLVENSGVSFADKAVGLFKKASDNGNLIASENLFLYLIRSSGSIFERVDYYKEIQHVKEKLNSNESDILYVNDDIWIYKKTVIDNTVPKNDDENIYQVCGSDYVYDDEKSMKWIYSYKVYEKRKDIDFNKCKLTYINN